MSARVTGGDGLRFFLQVAIVLHHGGTFFEQFGWLKKQAGAVSVSGFFILSGFTTYGSYTRHSDGKAIRQYGDAIRATCMPYVSLIARNVDFLLHRCLPLVVLTAALMPLFWMSHPPFLAPYAEWASTPFFVGWFQRWSTKALAYEYQPPAWYIGVSLCLWLTTPLLVVAITNGSRLFATLALRCQRTAASAKCSESESPRSKFSWFTQPLVSILDHMRKSDPEFEWFGCGLMMAMVVFIDLTLWFVAPRYEDWPPNWPIYCSSWTRTPQYCLGISLAHFLSAKRSQSQREAVQQKKEEHREQDTAVVSGSTAAASALEASTTLRKRKIGKTEGVKRRVENKIVVQVGSPTAAWIHSVIQYLTFPAALGMDVTALLFLWYIRYLYDREFKFVDGLFGTDIPFVFVIGILAMPHVGRSFTASLLNCRFLKNVCPTASIHLLVYLLHVPLGAAGSEIEAYHEVPTLIVFCIPLWILSIVSSVYFFDNLSLLIKKKISLSVLVDVI